MRRFSLQKPDIADLEVIEQELSQMFGLGIAPIDIMPHDFDFSLLRGRTRVDIAFLVVVLLLREFIPRSLGVGGPTQILKMMNEHQGLGIGEALG
jgi:hypothetical protein